MRTILAVLVFLLASLSPALAVNPDEVLADPMLEARARDISSELRCMVCQNQSIDDSNADLAKDLRVLVRERLTAGDTDDEVRAYLVSRYGEFVLLKPPLGFNTMLLWGMPLALLVIGGVVIFIQAARRRRPVPAPPLSDEEQKTLDAILAERLEK